MRRFSRDSRRCVTSVPARISSYQLVDTVYPYDWRVRTFGWYRTSTLIRIRKLPIPDSSTPWDSQRTSIIVHLIKKYSTSTSTSTRTVLSYDSTSTGSFMFHILEGNFLAVLIFAPTNGGLITTTHQTVPTARNRNECVSVRRKSQLRGRHKRRKCCPTSRVFLVRLTIL